MAIVSRRYALRAGSVRRRQQRWQAWEDSIVREHAGNRAAIRELLPHRSVTAITERLRTLHLRPKGPLPWKTTEIQEIRQDRGSSTIAELAVRYGRTTESIKMVSRGLRPRRINDEGYPPLIVALRKRGRQRGIGPRILGRLASSNESVFTTRSTSWKSIPAIVRAVEILDGDLTVVWDED